MMVRWMCGVDLKSRTASADLSSQLGIECTADVVRLSRLWLFDHKEIKYSEDWISACKRFGVYGVRNRGRETSNECAKKDMVGFGL